MKRLIPLILACTLLFGGNTKLDDSLEEIRADWYTIGFQCGQASVLNENGYPLPKLEKLCSEWNTRFKTKIH